MCIIGISEFFLRLPQIAVKGVSLSIDYTNDYIIVALQFNSHKSVQKLFHNLHIIFTNSLRGLNVFLSA